MKKQIALCIGNDNYQFDCLNKLKCAVNDSQAIAEKLSMLNFEVYSLSNVNREQLFSAVSDFAKKLSNYDVALFYFAGHGFECNGDNYLMPIDTGSLEKGAIEWMATPLTYVIDALNGNIATNNVKTKIIILDACRESPHSRGSNGKSFAPIFAPSGTIIAFSTSPGQIAKENVKHGYYTEALLNKIDFPRIPIENMFKHVREELAAKTNGNQISWEHTSLMGNYYFNEDTIDSFSFYSLDALADSNFVCKNSNVRNIIEKLKIHNWDLQGDGINDIISINFVEVSPNDLFVLGRNIYQAAEGNSFKAEGFISSFEAYRYIPQEAKIHLLAGMAFEIYFNKFGDMRIHWKSKHYLDILRLLEKEEYQQSKNFIIEHISKNENIIMYIPSAEERFELYVNCSFLEESNDEKIYTIESIYFQGEDILFNSFGTERITEDDYYWTVNHYSMDMLRYIMAEVLAAPPDMVLLQFNIEKSERNVIRLPKFTLRSKPIECEDDI